MCSSLPRGPLDFAHLAGVSANVLLSTPTTSDPGSFERVQLHRGRGVHRGAGHAWPSSHVSDPQGQQGTRLPPSPGQILYLEAQKIATILLSVILKTPEKFVKSKKEKKREFSKTMFLRNCNFDRNLLSVADVEGRQDNGVFLDLHGCIKHLIVDRGSPVAIF